MKFQFKKLAAVAAFSMIAGSSFAASFDLATAALDVATSPDFLTRSAAITAIAITTPTAYDDNVAVVNQGELGGPNFAYVDQSGGAGNFAAVMQDGTNPASAVVLQVGSLNRAIVNQH